MSELFQSRSLLLIYKQMNKETRKGNSPTHTTYLYGQFIHHLQIIPGCLVLATVPKSRVGSDFGSARNRTVAMVLTTPKTRPTGNGPVLQPKTRHFNITTLPLIKDLSSDRIITWSVRRLCSSTRSFTSRYQICDPTNFRWVTIKYPIISLNMSPLFKATQRRSVGSQIGKRKVTERPELHILRADHVMIRWELKYLIGNKGVGTAKLELRSGSNPAEKPRDYVRSG